MERLNILGKWYTVDWPTEATDKGQYGSMDDEKQMITIVKGTLANEQDTVLHEVIHSIERQLGLTMKEVTVRALACALLDTFWRNPELVPFLMREHESDNNRL